MTQKYIIFSLIILAFIGVLFITTSPVASLFDFSEKTQWKTELLNANTNFFKTLAGEDNPLSEIIEEYSLISEVQTEKIEEYTFFSFLGTKPNTSILSSFYGFYNGNKQTITTNPPLLFSILQKQPLKLYVVNQSEYPVPIDGDFFLMPQNIKVKRASEEKIIYPGDFVIFEPMSGEIPDGFLKIESLKYGFIISLL